jgi:hypothetical protein
MEAVSNNPKSVEATIKRLTREIEEIDRFFYKSNEADDRALYAGMLERKRDDMVRSTVLQIHTSIEDLLNSYIAMSVLGNDRRRLSNADSGQALQKLLFGGGSLGFEMKLNLARALKLISTQTRDRLAVLNTLRNKCSHNWLLKGPVRRGKRPAQKKPPLLIYEGRDLHSVATLKDFANEFTIIYLKLYMKFP